MDVRLPAEWEAQDAVLLAWPHADTDWAPILKEAEAVFTSIAAAVADHEYCLIAVPESAPVKKKLAAAGAVMKNIRFYDIDTNDTWSRDFGPVTITYRSRGGKEKPFLLDFFFNGWGLKYPAYKDNLVTRVMHSRKAFRKTPLKTAGMVLEGGGIESDGRGTLLTTESCLLSPNRNPHLSRAKIENKLGKWLGADRVLWLSAGALEGDDTDGHIDTLARFAPNDTIVYIQCRDPKDPHYPAMKKMEKELRAFRTREGSPYRLLALPFTAPIRDESGDRMPATYANFLVTNRKVLVPLYNDAADSEALAVIAKAYPGRQVHGINCLPLIRQHGSLHCVTMQIPRGVLS